MSFTLTEELRVAALLGQQSLPLDQMYEVFRQSGSEHVKGEHVVIVMQDAFAQATHAFPDSDVIRLVNMDTTIGDEFLKGRLLVLTIDQQEYGGIVLELSDDNRIVDCFKITPQDVRDSHMSIQ